MQGVVRHAVRHLQLAQSGHNQNPQHTATLRCALGLHGHANLYKGATVQKQSTYNQRQHVTIMRRSGVMGVELREGSEKEGEKRRGGGGRVAAGPPCTQDKQPYMERPWCWWRAGPRHTAGAGNTTPAVAAVLLLPVAAAHGCAAVGAVPRPPTRGTSPQDPNRTTTGSRSEGREGRGRTGARGRGQEEE